MVAVFTARYRWDREPLIMFSKSDFTATKKFKKIKGFPQRFFKITISVPLSYDDSMGIFIP